MRDDTPTLGLGQVWVNKIYIQVVLKEMVSSALIEHLTPIREEMTRNEI